MSTYQQKTFHTKAAAAYIGVSVSYLNTLRIYNPEKSPPFAKIGSRVVYPVAALEAWLEARTVNRQRDK